jgi:heme exporter protein B
MQMIRLTAWALSKDLLLEVRRGYALGGLLVFVLCIAFVIYLALPQATPAAWITLFWLAFLFISIHTALKSFAGESSRRYLYYYTLMPAEVLFISKCIFNTVLIALLTLLLYGAMSLVAGNPVVHQEVFLTAIAAGAVGVALCFTFISGIAIKSDRSATMMTILAFPLFIPILLSLIRLSQTSLMPTDPVWGSSLLTLGAIDLLLIGMGLLLFPYLWKS